MTTKADVEAAYRRWLEVKRIYRITPSPANAERVEAAMLKWVKLEREANNGQ